MWLIYIFLFLFFIIAICDFLFHKVPNILSLSLFLITCARILFLAPSNIYFYGYVLLISFIICFFLYAIKVLGAGDSKLLIVCTLFASSLPNSYQMILIFLLITSITGGILGVVYSVTPLSILKIRYLTKLSLYKIAQEININKIASLSPPVPINQEKLTFSKRFKQEVPYSLPMFIGCIYILYYLKGIN